MTGCSKVLLMRHAFLDSNDKMNIRMDVADAVRAPQDTAFHSLAVTRPSQHSAQEEGPLIVPQQSGSRSDQPEDFEALMTKIGLKYIDYFPDPHDFQNYMQNMGLTVKGARLGSLVITVHCGTLEVLEKLWSDYTSGHFNEIAEKFLVTQDLLDELGYARIRLKTYISEEEYQACHARLIQGM